MAQQSALSQTLSSLANLGLYDVILPFLLLFVLTYGILTKTKLLGDNSENLNAMFAFSFALIVVGFAQIVQIMNALLANIGLILVILFSFLILVGTLLSKDQKLEDLIDKKYLKALVVLLFFIVLMVILGIIGALDNIYRFISRYNYGALLTNIIILAFFILLIGWIVKEGKNESN